LATRSKDWPQLLLTNEHVAAPVLARQQPSLWVKSGIVDVDAPHFYRVINGHRKVGLLWVMA